MVYILRILAVEERDVLGLAAVLLCDADAVYGLRHGKRGCSISRLWQLAQSKTGWERKITDGI